MKSVLLVLSLLIASVAAFAPSLFGVTESNTACFAKHVKKKAAKWAADKRPRKSRPSDINRKPVVYAFDTMEKPPEYTITDAPAVMPAKPEKIITMTSED
mmetsp:Transcript_26023/g.36998  ORF Transcript_26023/g.36998 Transcript_26023/m.36998 type:complete len:100 (-) Transcript_26023:49-348(-)|eukprot:CAMPEP_0202443614 /NCGR_PEP_ID=MMETSP1360-20130828/2828_1 /ASSEMBLY_ACC=CAM_ASM_000848 /TAXON_ID=515479 /ORGANISM="Licmophora paradoxa, Strain CCMP2313" /LENGTH=99 /DNA_ID=CAMNT_0049059345 /DNA_START=68 /DNA_END=367 /DNA_ORIENTATION=+